MDVEEVFWVGARTQIARSFLLATRHARAECIRDARPPATRDPRDRAGAQELSEPLMHRQLFLEWLTEFHQNQYVSGDSERRRRR